jgi:2,4-dienoyl-CoA reductase-like NADH-dependent reductase (Old Yellow Enzyme family)
VNGRKVVIVSTELFSAVQLRSGLVVNNRIAKAAMEENMAGPKQVPDERTPLQPFVKWAAAGKAGGAAMWMQINHPGRQMQAQMPGVVWAPSAVGVELGKHSKRFGRPVASGEP